jgi:hypothetical protein
MRRLSVFAMAVLVAGVLVAASGTAWADPYTGPAGQTPKVSPAGFSAPASGAVTNGNGTQVLGEQFTRAANGGFLATTGADILGTAAFALLCVGLGVVLVRRTRRGDVGPPASAA